MNRPEPFTSDIASSIHQSTAAVRTHVLDRPWNVTCKRTTVLVVFGYTIHPLAFESLAT